jgi:tape measure domain-containing protein
MADTTRLIIELQTILRGLNETLRGLDQIKKKLESVASVKLGQQSSVGLDRAAAATQRLANQQQKLAIQSQELTNRQERARQSTERLALSHDRLTAAQQRAARANLGPQMDAHVQEFKKAEAATKALNERLATTGNALRSVGQGLASIGATLTVAVTAPLTALGVTSVSAAVELDSLKRGLTAIVGSADEAGRQLQRLTVIAKLPGIGFEEAIQGSIRLQAVGFSAKEAERDLREFSNAVALTGGGRDELARVTIQLGQLAAKGKVLSQDLRPIIEAAPAVGRALLQAFGTVNAADIQELGLSSKEFLNTLVDELERLPRAAAGAKNSFENFRDEIFRAAAVVGEALLPALIQLTEIVGPVVTKLADVFAKLPRPVQLVGVGLLALLAAAGPVLFVVGQLTLGIGRLLVGFVELNAAGILPTIVSLRGLTAASLSAAAAQRTLGISSIALGGIVGGIAAVLGTVIAAYVTYNAFQKDAVTLSKERADALTAEIDQLKDQTKFLDGLKVGVKRTGDEQERLLEIYNKLNSTAQLRVAGVTDEEKRLGALREELQKLINLRNEERTQQAGNIAGQLANTLQSIAANEKEIDSITERIQANNRLAESLRASGKISDENSKQLARQGIVAGGDVQQALGGLQTESENLLETQKALRENTIQLNGTAKEQAETLRVLERQTGLSSRELLTAAKNMGVFKGDIEQTLVQLDRYVQLTDEATKATDAFSRALSQQVSDALKAGDQADALAKARKGLIEANVATAREASDSFEGALKFFRAFIAAQPELQRALQREAQIQGKTFDEVVQKSLQDVFKGRDKSGTSLRNAQQELAKALAEVALASGEEQVRIEKETNERRLRAIEVAQRIQLLSYREFLESKAELTTASVDKEIGQQVRVARAARDLQIRLLAAAEVGGIPAAERVRRQAQAAKANEEAIKAEGKLNQLTAQREQLQVDLRQELALSQHEQVNDIRQLDIELAQLQGHVEDAFNAETVDRFREKLVDLSKAQVFLARLLADAKKQGDADLVDRLTREQRLNKEQIDAINLIIQQKDALGALAAAEELVRQAKEKQQSLEEDLTFQVQFRGLKEEDAIKQRLTGEERLNNSLTLAHETIRQIVEALQARGIEPPRALLDFLKEIQGAVRGLGELSFSEQFRLAQKEFDRLNDERLQKISDIERAVRERDIAEAEGLLLIRRINGQYSADLEQQLVLLKQIAAQSNDVSLQRQAQQAGETVKDANEQLASFDRQLRSASIDALQESLTNFFSSLSDNTKTAKEKLLDLVNSVATRIEQVIAENLSKRLIESIFGDGSDSGGGVIVSLKRLFGGGGKGSTGGIGGIAASGINQTTQATAAATTLTTGATAASAALTTGGVSAGTALVTGATAAAASIVAAGAAFAATVAASSVAQGFTQGIGGLGSAIGAATGMFPAVEGGLVHIVEGGFPEAVLTTDPRHAARQLQILKAFLHETQGLGGRIRGLAMGGFTDRIDISAPSVQVSNAGIGELAVAGAPSTMRLRQVLVDQRDWRNEINSPEGEQVLVDFLYKKQHVIRKISGGGK